MTNNNGRPTMTTDHRTDIRGAAESWLTLARDVVDGYR